MFGIFNKKTIPQLCSEEKKEKIKTIDEHIKNSVRYLTRRLNEYCQYQSLSFSSENATLFVWWNGEKVSFVDLERVASVTKIGDTKSCDIRISERKLVDLCYLILTNGDIPKFDYTPSEINFLVPYCSFEVKRSNYRVTISTESNKSIILEDSSEIGIEQFYQKYRVMQENKEGFVSGLIFDNCGERLCVVSKNSKENLLEQVRNGFYVVYDCALTGNQLGVNVSQYKDFKVVEDCENFPRLYAQQIVDTL